MSDFRYPGFSGLGPIPLDAMLHYCALVGYTATSDQFHFVNVMRACDATYRRYAKEQMDRESKKNRSSSSSPRSRRR